jgi:hypothetical protein
MILRHVPYVQTNFVLGLDCDRGAEPFELTKQFVDLAPGAYPAFSLLTAYGQAAPLNLDLQRAGRVLPFPFHFLDSNHAMNVRPLNYAWPEFYDHAVDLTKYALSGARVRRRFLANRGVSTRFSIQRRHIGSCQRRQDPPLADKDVPTAAHRRESSELPKFYENRVRESEARCGSVAGGRSDA